MSDLAGAAASSGNALDAVSRLLDKFDVFGVTTASFFFVIDGKPIGSFRSLSGMEVTIEEFSFAEGGNNHSEIKRPGRMNWSNLVLKRGISPLDTLFDWINKASGEGFSAEDNFLTAGRSFTGKRTTGANKFDAQTGSLTLVSPLGIPLRSWWVYEATPVRWTGPDFSAATLSEGETVPTEELEIAHQGIKRVDLP